MEVKKLYFDIVQKRFGNAHDFFFKVQSISQRLGIFSEWLNDVMYIETGGTFDPKQKNLSGSGATGLIQFMPKTAIAMKTTTTELSKMSNIRQLDFVEAYIKDRIKERGRPKDGFDIYLMVFYPIWVGKPDTLTMTLKDGNANIQIDKKYGNSNGIVSKGEFRNFYNKLLPKSTILETIQKKSLVCPHCLLPL